MKILKYAIPILFIGTLAGCATQPVVSKTKQIKKTSHSEIRVDQPITSQGITYTLLSQKESFKGNLQMPMKNMPSSIVPKNGEFVVYKLNISNNSKKTFDAKNVPFYVVIKGKTYSIDKMGDMYYNKQGFYNTTIQKGTSETGSIVFDIPKQIKIPNLKMTQ